MWKLLGCNQLLSGPLCSRTEVQTMDISVVIFLFELVFDELNFGAEPRLCNDTWKRKADYILSVSKVITRIDRGYFLFHNIDLRLITIDFWFSYLTAFCLWNPLSTFGWNKVYPTPFVSHISHKKENSFQSLVFCFYFENRVVGIRRTTHHVNTIWYVKQLNNSNVKEFSSESKFFPGVNCFCWTGFVFFFKGCSVIWGWSLFQVQKF